MSSKTPEGSNVIVNLAGDSDATVATTGLSAQDAAKKLAEWEKRRHEEETTGNTFVEEFSQVEAAARYEADQAAMVTVVGDVARIQNPDADTFVAAAPLIPFTDIARNPVADTTGHLKAQGERIFPVIPVPLGTKPDTTVSITKIRLEVERTQSIAELKTVIRYIVLGMLLLGVGIAGAAELYLQAKDPRSELHQIFYRLSQ